MPQESHKSKVTTLPKRLRLKSADKGFALVATLMLMVLLALVAIGILSLSSVTLRSMKVDDAMLQARANARMGLMLAIGELQKSMGPDRRISARASTLSQDDRIGTTLAPTDPRSWWVGVAGTNSAFGLDAENAVSATNPAAVWLVSGLNPSTSAASQLTESFTNPVDMFGEYSIDLSMTGGEPLTAGIVRVLGNNADHIGGYAYFVDDEGMKAQLAPSNVALVNTSTPSNRSDLTPGAYDVSMLDGMSALDGNSLSNYWKILSTGDLALVGGDRDLAARKRFSYTTYSRGVLCDVKNGGLKRDLTAAFEDDLTFAEVFPRGTGNYTADYLTIDADKLDASPELQQNGYIHWEVFKDYYNTKRHIKTATDGTKYLDPVRYSKSGPYLESRFNGTVNFRGDPLGSGGWDGSMFTAGRLGPHQIGDDKFFHSNSSGPVPFEQMPGIPYGDYMTDYKEYNPASNRPDIKNHREFKHSPVIPILQRMQVNAWMEQLSPTTIRAHAQLWSSHYNPYNIAVYAAGDNGGASMLAVPRIKAYSADFRRDNVRFRAPHENGGNTGRQTNVLYLDQHNFTSINHVFLAKELVMLQPGRSHVLAYAEDAEVGVQQTDYSAIYSEQVKDLTVESVYRDFERVAQNPATGVWDVPTALPADFDMKIRVFLFNAAMNHGTDDSNWDNFELCQTFWAPFAWNNVENRPGKEFDLGRVSAATLNENKMASLGLNLRSTRERDGGIRPLVDANIRCMFGNTRWDSPLNLNVLASYSSENQNIIDEMIMQMSTVDDPKGYTYWGAGRDPSFGFDRVTLFDIPRSDLVSLGQLQHAGAGRFSYEPTYIAGNSYANPRISQRNWVESVTDTLSTDAVGLRSFPILDPFNLYDASYLVNEVLWDGYTFTTIPQVADNVSPLPEASPDDAHFENLSSGAANLPHARYLPYHPDGSSFDRATLQMASNKADSTGAFYHNAGHILVDGAFNVNSTSIDAWEAFITSTHSLPVEKLNEKGQIIGFDDMLRGVRFPRTQTVLGEGAAKDDMDENFWTGYRNLDQTEVRSLAVAIVDEVKKRGPFLTMGEFVNRKLENGELGEAGALQAALDRTVNDGIDSEYALNKQGAGFPGQLLQGDVLQALAPTMTVRSDVFIVRAYGESVSATTGKVLARAWCEARVQRFPDPVDSGGAVGNALQELSNPSSPFGRKFRMISFRWLNPNEI